MASRFFGTQRPEKPHLVRGSGGLAGEIADLRGDVEVGFTAVQAEVDAGIAPAAHDIITSHSGSGLTPGNVIRASAADAFAFAQLGHGDLGSVGANDHHDQAHQLDGSDHTVSGLTIGNVLRASAADAFAFAQLAHSDLGSITATDHHSNANDPTADEKAALAGSSGSPSASNTYVTEADPARKRETIRFHVPGTIATGTEQGGVWEAPAAASIVRATAYRKSTAGTGGSTIVDVNIGGTTIFTTQTNRPEIAFDDSDGKSVAPAIEAGTLALGDMVTVDVDAIDTGGSPSDLTVILTVEYSA